MVTVKWTQRARDDLRDTHDFIRRDSPRAAEALVARILGVAERLAMFPKIGRGLPEYPELGYREIIVSSYRLIYRLEGEVVLIAAVIHGRRKVDLEGQ